MSTLMTTPRGRPPTAIAAVPAQRVLAVEFRALDGRIWSSIGGGATVAAAIVDALTGCPSDAAGHVAGWNDLYGE